MSADQDEVWAWLEQAKADLQAASVLVDENTESHRRYWLQQAYEKAVKAFGLSLLESPSEEHRAELRGGFLRHHDPVRSFEAHPPASKVISALKRRLSTFVRSHPEYPTLDRLEEHKARLDSSSMSYRYPFKRAQDATWIAPARFADWSELLGSFDKSREAVRSFVTAVENEHKKMRRGGRW